jgi:hypothetical protein
LRLVARDAVAEDVVQLPWVVGGIELANADLGILDIG